MLCWGCVFFVFFVLFCVVFRTRKHLKQKRMCMFVAFKTREVPKTRMYIYIYIPFDPRKRHDAPEEIVEFEQRGTPAFFWGGGGGAWNYYY